MGRSLQALSSGKFYFQEDFIFAGAQSAGSAPHYNSLARPPFTNLNHSYPVAGARRKPSQSRWTGLTREQPEFVARNTATLKSVQTKRGSKIPLLKVLESP